MSSVLKPQCFESVNAARGLPEALTKQSLDTLSETKQQQHTLRHSQEIIKYRAFFFLMLRL